MIGLGYMRICVHALMRFRIYASTRSLIHSVPTIM